jgi:hypothetical protein
MPDPNDKVRKAIVSGEEEWRDVEEDEFAFEPDPQYKLRKNGPKIILTRESNLDSFMEFDYNPTVLPFSRVANWNDKTIIGEEEGLEFKGMGKSQFTWELFLTDWGYHRAKTRDETVLEKLNWLNAHIVPNSHMVEDDEGNLNHVLMPYVIFITKGVDSFRALITKIAGRQTLLNRKFDPIRATVNVTFRRIERRRKSGFTTERTLRVRTF